MNLQLQSMGVEVELPVRLFKDGDSISIPAFELVPDGCTKDSPLVYEGINVHPDGFGLEFATVGPRTLRYQRMLDFIHVVEQYLDEVDQRINHEELWEKYSTSNVRGNSLIHGYKNLRPLDTNPLLTQLGWGGNSVWFLDEWGKEVQEHPTIKEMGCAPDLCVYSNAWKSPNPNINLRSAGIHLHLGVDKVNEEIQVDIIKALELRCLLNGAVFGVGRHSLHMARWNPGVRHTLTQETGQRRKLYGQAGSYRPKEYGVEYRSLPFSAHLGMWQILKIIFQQIHPAIALLNQPWWKELSLQKPLWKKVERMVNAHRLEVNDIRDLNRLRNHLEELV